LTHAWKVVVDSAGVGGLGNAPLSSPRRATHAQDTQRQLADARKRLQVLEGLAEEVLRRCAALRVAPEVRLQPFTHEIMLILFNLYDVVLFSFVEVLL
jgi:hypothetical protein